jgi:membrane protein implicated in regulation of membrane protease activity
MQAYQLTLCLALVLAILEISTLSFISLSFALALLPVAALQYFSGHFSLARDVVWFAVGSLGLIVAFRMILKKKKDQMQATEQDINVY